MTKRSSWPTERVLEIGTGSGYQARCSRGWRAEVISVESHTSLALAAQERLVRLGYANVHVHNGDGFVDSPTQRRMTPFC